MGHTIGEWRAKVSVLLRDEAGVDAGDRVIEDTGLFLAFSEHSRWFPFKVVEEVAGTGSSVIDLPERWVAGTSEWGLKVEYPARQTPPTFLARCYWRMGRSAADPDVEQIHLDVIPVNGQYVRLWFPGRWPIPTDSAADDRITDGRFEAVAALAAAYVCDSLATVAARGRDGAIPSDLVAGEDRRQMLSATATSLRAQYRQLAGISLQVA